MSAKPPETSDENRIQTGAIRGVGIAIGRGARAVYEQVRLRVPWPIAAASGLVLVMIALFLVWPNVPVVGPSPTPTPMAFKPAEGDQSLVVVVRFSDRSGGSQPGLEPAERIFGLLNEIAGAGDLRLRVEQLREPISDTSMARRVGELYGATVVVWGWYDREGISPRIQPVFDPSHTDQFEFGEYSLSDPEQVESNVVTEMPAQAAFQTLVLVGHAATEENDVSTAIRFYSAALALTPRIDQVYNKDVAKAYHYRGASLYNQGAYEEAIRDLDRAIALNPEYGSAYSARGMAKGQLDRLVDAVADMTEAIRLGSQSASLYYSRGGCFERLGENERALRDFSIAMQLDPHDVGAYVRKAYIHETLGQYQDALETYAQGLANEPDNPDLFFFRSRVYNLLDENELALADLDRAIDLAPGEKDFYTARGIFLIQTGDYEAAGVDLERALELDPEWVDALKGMAMVAAQQGDLDQALELVNRAIDLSADAQTYLVRATIYRSEGYVAEAIADYHKVIRLDPFLPEPYDHLMILEDESLNLSYWYKAEAARNLPDNLRIAAKNPMDAGIHFVIGRDYAWLEQWDAAMDFLSRSIEIDPALGEVYWERGRVFAEMENPESAVADFSDAVRLGLADERVYNARAESHEQLGDLESARDDYREILAITELSYWEEKATNALERLGGE